MHSSQRLPVGQAAIVELYREAEFHLDAKGKAGFDTANHNRPRACTVMHYSIPVNLKFCTPTCSLAKVDEIPTPDPLFSLFTMNGLFRFP